MATSGGRLLRFSPKGHCPYLIVVKRRSLWHVVCPIAIDAQVSGPLVSILGLTKQRRSYLNFNCIRMRKDIWSTA